MPTKIAVPTATIQLVSAARTRQAITVQNQGTVDVYIAWDATASSVTIDTGSYPGLKIPAGGTWGFTADGIPSFPPFNTPIYAVHGSGSTQNLSVQEI